MKILVLSNGWTTQISGGDEHILQVTRYWSKAHDISFLLPSSGYRYAKRSFCDKIKLYVYHTPLEKSVRGMIQVSFLYLIRVLSIFLVILKGLYRDYEIIITSSHYPYDVIPAMLLKRLIPNSRVVVYFHSLDIPHLDFGLPRIVSLITNFFSGLLIKMFADGVITVNSYTLNFLSSLGIKRKKIFLSSNGVAINCANFMQSSKRRDFDGCFIGRHVRHKGIYDLLNVWKIVCQFKADAKLAICGHGEETPKLAELIRQRKMEHNIILLGFVPENKKYEILCSSQMFIFPSYLEGWGIAIAEAMACGLPVIAYDLPVYHEVFDGKLITVDLGDIDAMAKCIIHLLKNPEEANRIGEGNRRFIQKYDWKEIAVRELSFISSYERKW